MNESLTDLDDERVLTQAATKDETETPYGIVSYGNCVVKAMYRRKNE